MELLSYCKYIFFKIKHSNHISRPAIINPSKLHIDITGKVVRYLQDNGSEVKEGEPYVELEIMKMIMPLKATESGKTKG